MRGKVTLAISLALRVSALVTLGGLLVAAVLVLGGGRDAQASHVDPVFVEANPSCADLGYDYEKKVEPPDSGTYPLDGHSVTVTRYGEYFDWTATLGMDAVIVKGGPDANVYVYDPPAESFGDTALHAPINPERNEPYGLSHISFCYDVDPDVEKVSLTLGTPDPATGDCTGPIPTDIDMSQDVPICTRQVLLNNGPYEVDVVDTLTLTAPPQCTMVPSDPIVWSALLLPGILESRDDYFTIHCSQASSHVFTFEDEIVITTPGITDSNPDNNFASAQLTVNVWADADLKVTNIWMDPWPAEIDVSQTFTATINATVHNNGPYGPTTGTVTFNANAPPDCTADVYLCAAQYTLPVSVAATVGCDVDIHCSEPSSHTFDFDVQISEPKEPHVVDPDPTNNVAWTSETVTAIAYSDMKVVAQYIANPPAEIAVSQDVLVVLEKVIHNNGTWGPVDAFTETIVTAPANCTVRPEVHVQQYHNVPVSVDILHHEPFTIHCYALGEYTFVFDDEVGLKEPHVRDLVAGNNTGSNTLTVQAVGAADVKITGVGFVDPPTKIPMGQDVDITLRKYVHNNGPWDPVDIAIDATAAAPTDCTVTAKSVPNSFSAVPISVDQVVDEVWTINCTDDWPPLKTFRFDNSIDVATPYVYDPDQANNSSRKWLSVRDPFYPYWGDEICDGQDNDADTVIDEGWDLSGSAAADCLDPALDTDGDTLTNDVDEDDDGDGWSNADEGFMRTDPLNACPIDAYHDAWPPDVNNDASVDILDVLRYKPVVRGLYDCRYDLNADGSGDILDVLLYKPVINTSCTNP